MFEKCAHVIHNGALWASLFSLATDTLNALRCLTHGEVFVCCIRSLGPVRRDEHHDVLCDKHSL